MGKPSGIWARGQHTVGPCPVPHSHECSCPSTGQGPCEPSLPQAQSPPPALSILSTMSTGMPMSSACACTWPPPSQPCEKEGQQAHIFPDKVTGASGARGAVRGVCCPQPGHLSREMPLPRFLLCPGTGQGHLPAAGTPSSPSSCYDIVLLLLCFSPGAFSSSPLPHPAETRWKSPGQSQQVQGRAGGRGEHPAASSMAGQGAGWQPPVPVATSDVV